MKRLEAGKKIYDTKMLKKHNKHHVLMILVHDLNFLFKFSGLIFKSLDNSINTFVFDN